LVIAQLLAQKNGPRDAVAVTTHFACENRSFDAFREAL
jgi:hypothetical protein